MSHHTHVSRRTRIQVNFWFLLLTIVPALALAGGLYFWHGRQVKRSGQLMLDRAAQARESGDTDEAKKYYQLFLGYEPNNSKALADYALLLSQEASSPADNFSAFLLLERALRQNPDRVDLRSEAIKLALAPTLQRYSDARFHLAALLKITPEAPALEDQLGQALEGLGLYAGGSQALVKKSPSEASKKAKTGSAETQNTPDPDPDRAPIDQDIERKYPGAREAYRLAIQHDPTRVDTHVRLATLLRARLDDTAAADRVMDAVEDRGGLISRNPQSAEAYLARHDYRRSHNLEGAEADLLKALELAPQNPDVQFAALEQAIAANNLEAARNHLEAVRAQSPGDNRLILAQAELDRRSGDADKARAQLEKGLEDIKDQDLQTQFQLRFALANLLIDGASYEPARKVIAELKKSGVTPSLIDYLEGRILYGEEKWAEAAQRLRAARDQLIEVPELSYNAGLILADSYSRLRDPASQIVTYRQAVLRNPADSRGHLGLAAALLSQGQLDEAATIYRSLAPEVPGLWATVARLLAVQVQQLPENRRDWKPVDEALDAAAKEAPGSDEITRLRAATLVARGQNDAARQVLTEALSQRPDSLVLRATLSSLLRTADPVAARAELEKLQDDQGDTPAVRLSWISYWAAIGGDEALPSLQKLEAGLDRFAPAEQERLRFELAVAHRRLGDLQGSRAQLARLLEVSQENIRLQATQLLWALEDKDQELARSTTARLSALLEKQPINDVELLSQLFDFSLRAADPALSRRLVDQLRQVEGGEGFYWRLAEATLTMREAAGQGGGATTPSSSTPTRARLVEARRLLEEASQRRPANPQALFLLGQAEELTGRLDPALQAYERARQVGSREPQLYLALFRLHATQGRMEQADAQIQEMQRLGLAADQEIVARLAVEGRLRQGAKPEEILTEARQAVSPESSAFGDHLWLARVAEAAGQPQQAEAALRKAVELGAAEPAPWIALVQFLARNERRDDALKAIEQARASIAPEKAALTLAQCLAAVADFDSAFKLIDKGLVEKPEDPALLRAGASLALVGSRDASLSEPYLRRLVAQKSQSPGDAAWARRLLAPLLAASGNARSQREAISLLGLGDDPARVNVRAGTIEERRTAAQVLALQPSASWLRVAASLLEQIVDRESAGTPADQFLLAQIYERLGQWPQARQRMTRLLATESENPQYLETFIAWLLVPGTGHDKPDPDTASPYLERLKKLAPDTLNTAQLEARYLAASGQNAAAVKRLEAHLAQHPETLTTMAALVEQLGTPAQAEPLYKQLITEKPDDPAVNFAWARFLDRQGLPRRQEAEAAYEHYIDLARSSAPESALVMAGFFARQNRVDEALEVCEKATESCRADAIASAAVEILLNTEPTAAQYERGGRLIDAALKQQVNEPALLFQMANLRTLQGRYDDAERLFRQSMGQTPENDGPPNNLAWLIALRDPKRASEALTIIDDAIARLGPAPELRETRAVVLLQLNNTSEAVQELDSLVNGVPNPAPLWLLHLAQAYHLNKQETQARDTLARARAAGLDAATLPALEKPPYNRLLEALARR